MSCPSPLLVLPAFALTYAVGWITNFCSERLLKIFFQRRIRDKRFGNPARYETAKVLMLQRGSEELVRDVLIDQSYIIRLARGGIINFALLAIATFTSWTAWPNSSVAARILEPSLCSLVIRAVAD